MKEDREENVPIDEIIKLKAPMDKTTGQSLENKSLEENLCILGVP